MEKKLQIKIRKNRNKRDFIFRNKCQRNFPGGSVVKTELPVQGMWVQFLVRKLRIPRDAWYGQKISLSETIFFKHIN